jgi:hypothetical protein
MDCPTAQEKILEALNGKQPRAHAPDLEGHLAGCEACRVFYEIQTMLDLQLSAALCTPSLSSAFRTSLAKRVQRERLSGWSDFLPDIAHVAGCICATALCVCLLPFDARRVILAGLEFTVVTYIAQAVFRSSIEAWMEDFADR